VCVCGCWVVVAASFHPLVDGWMDACMHAARF